MCFIAMPFGTRPAKRFDEEPHRAAVRGAAGSGGSDRIYRCESCPCLVGANRGASKLLRSKGSPITATAVVAAIGNGRTFDNGRQFAAWLGLIPRQHSSGQKQRLFGITKRGDPYLRTLLIHGARAVVFRTEFFRLHTIW